MNKLDELKLANAGLTVSRMVKSYKDAINPSEHITILSDQTLIEPEHIVEILQEAGCKVGKYHKRWTPGQKRELVDTLERFHETSKKSQECEEKSHEIKKEEKKVAEKRQYHRKSKEELEEKKQHEAAEQPVIITVTKENIVLPADSSTRNNVIAPDNAKLPAPKWLYDLAETEYALVQERVKPYLKDVERMRDIEEWMNTHEAV